MIDPELRWPLGLLYAAAVAGAVVAAGGESLPRTLVVLGFLLLCPGLALLRLAGGFEGLTSVVLALALSIALDMGVALTLAYTGLWSAQVVLGVLIAVVVAAVALDVHRREVIAR
jgi:uncharacterized membrane protein